VFYFRLGRNVLLAQVCCSVERIYVDVAVKDEFEKKVVELAKSYTVGPGLAPGSKVGPMVSGMQRDAVAAQVEAALKDGARLLYRSSVPSTEGNWFPVTVLSSLRQSMAIQTCETFGPVVSLASFDGSEAEAVRLANDTEYGLAAYVYTTDPRRAQRVAAGIKAGQVGINCYTMTNAHLECPWVGHKGSGMGYHSGADGWRQFSLPKSVVFDQSIPAPLTVFSSL
jgi:acyl-CoA reductase-like NAD-dependent aldehyde dehydrogenase